MTTKVKLETAIKQIGYALDELNEVSYLLSDPDLRYSYTDLAKAVGMLENCLLSAKEEKGYDCPECGGTGEVINELKVNSASIDIPYKTCTNCCGRGEVDE